MRESIVCARRAQDGTITIGIAYDLRNEVSLSSDGTIVARHPCSVGRHSDSSIVARHPCSVGRHPVLGRRLFRHSDPLDTTGSLPIDERRQDEKVRAGAAPSGTSRGFVLNLI